MNYPLISEYIDAISNAEDNFDQLSNLWPVLDADGNPVMTSGNFAVVFKMTDGTKDYAIKCFTREQEGRAEAYRLIADELEFVYSSFLCHMKYYDNELFVDSKNSTETEFPVLLMDWVGGVTLDNYVRDNLHDSYAMSNLAYQFCRLAQWLLTQPFAHGDLKPDNILVREDGLLVLVDYDGMFVPAMKGQNARELGSPNYRHPLRTAEQFDEHIDDFALASIALSLKAIALSPTIYDDYGAADRLLFSDEDYRNLSESEALTALQSLLYDTDLSRLFGLFLIAHSQQELSNVSFRLFSINKPEKPVIGEYLSTVVTDEDLADAWEDEDGVKYSRDRKRLLKGNKELEKYDVRNGTIVICDKAFAWCTSLQSIQIPSSVISIGDWAFSSCLSLESINIPSSIKSIGDWAFSDCESLDSINIPSSVTSIGGGAFCDCSSLCSINIPSSVTSIGDYAFYGCSSLQSINIPSSVTSIGDWAFCDCSSLRAINIPSSVTSIGDYAFYGCSSLQSINIPSSVTSIWREAFCGCTSLQSIYVPYGTLEKFEKLLPEHKEIIVEEDCWDDL